MLDEKQVCVDILINLLSNGIQTLENELKEVVTSRDNESKSSVGDKYETGRAMMQLRQEQLEKQLAEQKKNLQLAKGISGKKADTKVGEGSFVKTNRGNYLIGLGLGEIKLGDKSFYSISLLSPFGQAIRNKVANDQFEFRGKNYLIEAIA